MSRALMVVALAIVLGAVKPVALAGQQQQDSDRDQAHPTRWAFDWSESPSVDLREPGPEKVNLTACPAGVTGSETDYYIHIVDAKVAEAVRVTGGTCKGDGQPGSLEFTTLHSHPSGFRIGSASGGIQEALIAARFTPTEPSGTPQAGRIIVPAGEYKVFARVSIRSSDVTLDLSGSIVDCRTSDTCIFIGDPSDSTAFTDVTVIGPRGRPTVLKGSSPFIEVNAQNTRVFNVSTRIPLAGGSFGSLVQIDDDQAFLLDGLTTSTGGAGVRCDAEVCNPVVFAPGPFNTYSAVGWLKNLNISLGCKGNGIDWASGNTLQISDSVVQGYAQYGIRAGNRRGGYGGLIAQNVYEEVGRCTNPAGNIGEAGIIVQGAGTSGVKIVGGIGPAGKVPQFAKAGNIEYRYYLVAHHASFGASNPLYAGNALSDGSRAIKVTTPEIKGAEKLDLLRISAVTGDRLQAPVGDGEYAVAVAVDPNSVCLNHVCTFTDAQTRLQSYTVSPPTYFPSLDYWPGALILGPASDTAGVMAPARAFLDNAFDSIVSVLGSAGPAVYAQRCDPSEKWTPVWISCVAAAPPSVLHEQGGLLLATKPAQDGGQQLNLKGRLNFGTLGTGPGHILTLSDSDFQKTVATANNRPANDPGDAFIGYDEANGDPLRVGISLGAPRSLSSYIANRGDGKAWLERLTIDLKTLKVPLRAASYQTLTNCVSSAGACGAAAAGKVAIAPGSTTVRVATSAVTQESEIHIDENFTYGDQLGVACDRTLGRRYAISEQTTGYFVIQTDRAPIGGAACLSFSITN